MSAAAKHFAATAGIELTHAPYKGMSQLVSELLIHARSGLKGVRINLVKVELRPLIEKAENGWLDVKERIGL